MSVLRPWFARYRQRLARVVLVGALLAIGLTLWTEAPREIELEYLVGPDHLELVELRVAYLLDGEPYVSARFDFPAGAPERIPHRVQLPQGRFEVQVDLIRGAGATVRALRSLRTPTDGLVRIRLP